MRVHKYSRQATTSALAGIHGFSQTIQEIWVEQEDGHHFVFNSEGGIFFSPYPLGDNGETIELEMEDIAAMREFLNTRERLKFELFEE